MELLAAGFKLQASSFSFFIPIPTLPLKGKGFEILYYFLPLL
jgi:hypothetical protein